jgi:hypothetical protein
MATSIIESYQGLRAVLSSRNREGHIIQVIQCYNAQTKSSENRRLVQFFNAAHSLHAQHGDQGKSSFSFLEGKRAIYHKLYIKPEDTIEADS